MNEYAQEYHETEEWYLTINQRQSTHTKLTSFHQTHLIILFVYFIGAHWYIIFGIQHALQRANLFMLFYFATCLSFNVEGENFRNRELCKKCKKNGQKAGRCMCFSSGAARTGYCYVYNLNAKNPRPMQFGVFGK